ncbi:MAG: lipoate--protein ligase family protein [Alkalibacterium sp.]|nr:lipoate--protein ligase family protein [Alkalibacterium sp.]
MTVSLDFLTHYQQPYYLYDSLPDFYTDHLFAPFALTDAFIKEAGETNHPILHFWQTEPVVVLGMMDTKLPFFKDSLSLFSDFSYDYLVRNSGGLAVVGDDGILNFSIVFPEEEGRLEIDEAYSRMHRLIQAAFSDMTKKIDAFEVTDSYCPGAFDLSIKGKKIAGTAQRRIRGGIAIMIYLSVSGNQTKRAEMIRSFYENGLKGTETQWTFPDVNPDSMTTLAEAFNTSLSVEEVKDRLTGVFETAGVSVVPGELTSSVHSFYEEGLEKMKKRNEKLLP